MAVVGSAEVIVRAITTQVKKDIDKAFGGLDSVMKQHGEALGKDFADAFGKSIKQNLGDHIDGAVHDAGKRAGTTLESELGTAGRRAGAEAGREIDQAIGNAGGSGGRRAGRNAGSGFANTFKKELSGAADRLLFITGLFDILGPTIAVAVAAVSSLTSGLFAMGAAASQAVGAIAVLPGLLAAAAQAGGAIKLAFGGISQALSLGTKAQDVANAGATTAAKSSAAAAKNAKNLAVAQKAVADAQKDVTATQKALTKAQNEAKDAGKGVEEAEARLRAAIEERNKVMSDPNASQADGAAAQAAVDAAQKAFDALNKDKSDAAKKVRKAAEDADRAQNKLTAAQKARDKAQKAASAGSGAVSPAVKAANAFQDALAQLTPEARAFVLAILDMRKRFHDLGEAIGKELFPPLTEALGLIGDSSFFKILQDNLTETGGIVGQFGLNLAKAFTTPKNQSRFENILKGNNNLLGKLNEKTKDGETPATALMNILLKGLRAIQPLTNRFGKWLAGVITGFDKANSEGGLKKFFNDAGDTAAQLGRIFRNIIKAVAILGGGAKKSGQGLLDSFENATKRLDKFLNKLRRKGALETFFGGAADNLRAIGDLIVTIGDEFFKLGDNKGVASFSKSLEPAVKNLGDIFDKLSQKGTGDALGKLFTAITDTIDQLTQSGQLQVFLDTITTIVKGVGQLAKGFNKIPGSGGILAVLAVFRGVGFVARIAGFGKSFDALRSSLFKLAKVPFQALARKLGLVKAASTDTTAPGRHKAGVPTTNSIPGAPTVGEGTARGLEVGKAIADGIALGIRENTAKVVTAIDDLGDAAIVAIKTKLGIASPSVVMTKYGENTGEGFVLGIRSETGAAFKAGEGLGAAAAAGARSVPVTPGVGVGGAGALKAAAPVEKAAVGALPAVASLAPALEEGALVAGTSAGKFGKLGKVFGSLGKGLSALVGGPIGIAIIAIAALVFGLIQLYKKSPQFKKFVDNIVKAIKPLITKLKELIDWVGKKVLNALDSFFGWVNDHMPQIKKVFSDVFGAIGKVITAITPVLTKVFSFVIDHWRIFLSLMLGPLGIAIALITKYWKQFSEIIHVAILVVKFYITKILIPYFKLIFRVVKALLPIAKAVFNGFKKAFTDTVHSAQDVWNNILKPVFEGVKDSVKDAFQVAKTIIQNFRDAWSRVSGGISKVADGVKSVFSSVRDAIVGAFTGLVDAIKTPLNAVISFINDHLIANINTVTSKFGLTISPIPGFAEGGYTGPGSKYKPAGIVHADEHVIRASSRRKIERQAPGLLDFMNRTGQVSFGTGGFGPIGDIASGVADLAGDTVGAFKDVGKAISKYGVGKVLGEMVKGLEKGMGAAGIGRSGFVNEFVYGILDKLVGAVQNWGGSAGKGTLAGGKWTYPLAGGPFPITQYANQGHSPPWAIDLGAPDGTPVLAASAGRIISAIDKGATSYGKYLVLAHAKGVTTLYAHLSSWTKSVGSTVAAGTQIAYSGHSGGVRSSNGGNGAHLHFEFRPSYDTLEEMRKRGVKFARGGIAKATTGGILSVIAEAGKNERVEPLDNNGMSKRDKEIMKMFAAGKGGGDLTVNITNPSPERASVSVAKGIRSKAVASGWGV